MNYVLAVREIAGCRFLVRALIVLGLCGLSAFEVDQARLGQGWRAKVSSQSPRWVVPRGAERAEEHSGLEALDAVGAPLYALSLSQRSGFWPLDLDACDQGGSWRSTASIFDGSKPGETGFLHFKALGVGGPRAPPTV
ncbi:MAG: hypothetical protein IT581_09440 [Verrucomicrobiales bacterium]|nr:hypothetical protein [Verrucomicrobiales bacterium]